MIESQFVFCTTQPGAEGALKAEVEARAEAWRFSFSRPGFVTFKLPEAISIDRFEPPRLMFARAIGLSLAKLETSEDKAKLASQVWGMLNPEQLAQWGRPTLPCLGA